MATARSCFCSDLRSSKLYGGTTFKNTGVDKIFQGIDNKVSCFENLCEELRIDPEHVAYLGDDLPDLPVLKRVGFAVAVANACPEVLAIAHWTTQRNGGEGALRECCDFILRAQGSEWFLYEES